MIKKTIEYTDLNGDKIKEELYFNMSTVDLTRFVARYSDYSNIARDDEESSAKALQQYIDKLVQSKDMPKMIEFLEDMILTSYGEKSQDGRRFVKSRRVREDFEYSIAYSTLFTELFADQDKMQKFISGIINDDRTSATTSKVTVIK